MREITKVLIANRGEIASRILRTLDHMAIPGVVVFHPADAGTPAVEMARERVELDGTTPVAAYLDMDSILDACRRTGADAVHPGYGFLAENADFARRLEEEGITFIGPLPETISLMGDKIAARSFCMKHGIPIIPSVTETDANGSFLDRAKKLGVPLLIKASSGGGGKGMHIVHNLCDLEDTVRLAKLEALRSFGSDAVYAERYLDRPRHIEVQIMADFHGNVLHLGERECSIQRRFQKIIEESPAPGLSPGLRRKLCAAAVDIARKASYRNAGTVEFILGPNGEFYFLEMNTRIQVEHPVTEMVTGLDLVELQIRTARGESLPLTQDQVSVQGHSVEVRLYAEDPANDFMPATGPLLVFDMPKGEGVRVDNGFTRGMHVSPAFDPMLAKIITHARDRRQTIARAIEALAQTRVLGVTVNRDYLSRILSHPAFGSGHIHTGFIETHGKDLELPGLTGEEVNLLLAATALGSREFCDPAFDISNHHLSMGQWRN